MKQSQPIFGQKSIETPQLNIRKNVMTWKDTMIQLSNISCVSASNIIPMAFPVWAVCMIMAGILLLKHYVWLAMFLCFAGGIWIYYWYLENEKRSSSAILTIQMNSGHSYRFKFDNKKFLGEVIEVLEDVISGKGLVGDQNISVNISNCDFGGNASVLDNLKINR